MGSVSILLASSGMLPDDLRGYCKSYEPRSRSRAAQPAGWQHANQSEQNARAPQSCSATYTVRALG